jgi:hypothetical protein
MNAAHPIAGAIALTLLLTEALWLRAPKEPAVPVSKVKTEVPLKIRRNGVSLRISWDGNSETMRRINHATLQIVDGSHNTQLELNAAEARAGKLVYWPETGDATFRLEVSSGASPPLVVAQNEAPVEPKPSPFDRPAHGHQLEIVSVATEPTPTAQSIAPASKPAGFFGRLADRIPLAGRLRKSNQRTTANSD